jgi:hypothetical protein
MIILLAAALAPVGCGKQKSPAPVPQGVSIDESALRNAFSTASPDLQGLSAEAVRGIRRVNYPAALAALGKLANAPGLTDAQKKVVTDVTAQVKQSASSAPAAPAQ